MTPGAGFLSGPGRPGAMGALLDEYARAAEDFCRVVEGFDAERFAAERPSTDPWTVSPQRVCAHVCRAARAYANYICGARGLPRLEELPADSVTGTRDVRPLLVAALQFTEAAVDGLHGATEEQIAAIRFNVRWGPEYDPDMLLEHAVCHLLRHRRQLERWDSRLERDGTLSAGLSGAT